MNLVRLYFRLFRQGYLRRQIVNQIRFGFAKAPRPFERLWLDPRSVVSSVNRHRKRDDSGLVVAGDWDLDTHPLSSKPKIQACADHFIQGLSWDQTGIFELAAQKIRSGEAYDGCISMADVAGRYRQLDEMYEALESGQPYLTMAELNGKRNTREKGGVHIHIGRNGEPIFGGGGNHRLAIAQILGLESIPVQLGIVHPAAVKAGCLQNYRQAPDRRATA